MIPDAVDVEDVEAVLLVRPLDDSDDRPPPYQSQKPSLPPMQVVMSAVMVSSTELAAVAVDGHVGGAGRLRFPG